ncbi:MAG: hypothetical protein KBB83_08100, partial [Alphaproteobacteria bacterium]|nr:hypothetical protein [Alphaproteobacteria bacterium]
MQHKFPLTNILYHLFLYLIFLTPFTYASSYDSESEDVYFPDLRRSSLDETIETPQPKKSTVNRAHVHTLTSHIRFNANNWDVYLDAMELIPEMHRPSPLPMHVYDFMKFVSHLSIDEVLPFLEHYQTLTTPIKPGSHSTPVSYLVDFLYFIPQEYKKNVSNRLWALFSFMKKHPCHVLAPEVFRNQEMNQYQAYQIFDDVIGNLKTGWIPCTQNKKPSWKNFTLALNRASVLYQDQLFE